MGPGLGGLRWVRVWVGCGGPAARTRKTVQLRQSTKAMVSVQSRRSATAAYRPSERNAIPAHVVSMVGASQAAVRRAGVFWRRAARRTALTTTARVFQNVLIPSFQRPHRRPQLRCTPNAPGEPRSVCRTTARRSTALGPAWRGLARTSMSLKVRMCRESGAHQALTILRDTDERAWARFSTAMGVRGARAVQRTQRPGPRCGRGPGDRRLCTERARR